MPTMPALRAVSPGRPLYRPSNRLIDPYAARRCA
jgi:hypothetical protein